jgi:hypothetical protein
LGLGPVPEDDAVVAARGEDAAIGTERKRLDARTMLTEQDAVSQIRICPSSSPEATIRLSGVKATEETWFV